MPMLIGNKKSQQNNQNWCIILSPVKNEIDRKRVAQKISEVFSLSSEEAMDLVTNTPIILLDNLTQSVASKIKDYFRPTGAEMVLSNDVFLKRKCYRTVWPTEPNLSFLHGTETPKRKTEETPAAEHTSEEAMGADDALHEIRSLAEDLNQEEGDEEDTPDAHSFAADQSAVIQSVENRRMMDEIRRLKDECFDLKEQRNQLRLQLEDLRSRQTGEASAVESHIKEQAEAREHEIKELRILLSNTEEKYEILKNEYSEARSIYEEKLGQAEERNQEDGKILQGLRTKMTALEEEHRLSRELLQKREAELDKVRLRYQSEGTDGQQKIQSLENDVIRWKSEAEKLSKEILRLETLVETKGAEAERLQQRNEESQKILQLHSEQGMMAKRDLEEKERQLREALGRVSDAEEKLEGLKKESAQAKAMFEGKIQEAEEKLAFLTIAHEEQKEKNLVLQDENKLLNEMVDDQKKSLGKQEKDFESRRKAVDQELSQARAEAEKWSSRAERMADEIHARMEDISALKKNLEEQQTRYGELENEADKNRRLLQARIDQDTQEIEDLKNQLQEASIQLEAVDQTKQHLDAKLQEQVAQASYWRTQSDTLGNELKSVKKTLADETQSREQAETRQRDTEKSQIRLLQELDQRSQDAQRWESEAKGLEERWSQANALCEKQQKLLEKSNAELEAREKEVETLRRQLREVNTQIEQREAVQRRNQLASQLAEREENLKRLVKQQEKVEAEIREREESMRAILSDQEKIEKEIIESKQAYRHLMEQAKRERTGKVKIARGANGNAQAQDEQGNGETMPGLASDDRTPA